MTSLFALPPSRDENYSPVTKLFPGFQLFECPPCKREITDLVERPLFVGKPLHLKFDLRVGHLAVPRQRF